LGIPEGLLTCFNDILPGNPEGTLFACDTGEIDFLLLMLSIGHDHMNQVFIDGSIQALQTHWTEKIDSFALVTMNMGMLYARIIAHFRMEQKQSFFSSRVPYLENNVFPNLQMSPAVRA
jgi:hypothetical protein